MRDFKSTHPAVDLTTIHPSYVYGPLGSGQVYNSPAPSSNMFAYELIYGAPGRPVGGFDPAVRLPLPNVDVRDVARAHVLALKCTPVPRCAEAVHHILEHVYVEGGSRVPRSGKAGAEGVAACHHWQGTTSCARRHIRYHRNGEDSWTEELCQVTGHDCGHYR